MAQQARTNYEEIQKMEVEALQAIYMDDFIEEQAKAAAWNTRGETRFKLHISSQSGEKIAGMWVTLSVNLPSTYPKTLPHIALLFGDGVPQKSRIALSKSVQDRAKALIGDVSIHEIAILVSERLDEVAVVVTESEKLPALDEERVQHQTEALQVATAAKNARMRDQELAQQQQEQVRSALVAREIANQEKIRQTKMEVLSSFDGTPPLDDGGPSTISFDQDITIQIPEKGAIVAFRYICDIDFHQAGAVTQVYTARPYTNTNRQVSNRRFLAMKVCQIGENWDEYSLKSEIAEKLEPSLRRMQNLSSHRNILPVLGFRIQSSNTYDQPRLWTVHVLTEFVARGSLADVVEVAGRVDSGMLRTIIIQALEGLQHLHTHNIAHERLSLANILVQRQVNGGITIKLTDCCYQSDLHYLKQRERTSVLPLYSETWLPPESSTAVEQRPGLGADVWALGIVAAQMAFGIDVCTRYTSPSSMMNELDITSSLEQMLLKMFHERPAKRLSCFDLLASTFLRSDEDILDHRLSPAVSRIPSNPSSFTPRLNRLRNGSTNIPGGTSGSRYANDFSDHTKLGKGGFGKVVRARNKLDGQWYALKTIVSESNHELQSVLSEVMLLSRLSHPHIVRYITAWIEEAFDDDTNIAVQDDSEDESEFQDHENFETTKTDGGLLSYQRQLTSRPGFDYIGSGAHVEFDAESDDGAESGIDDAIDGDACPIVFGTSSAGKSSEDESLRKLATKTHQSAATNVRTNLHIQMEFCENQTLRDLIRNGLASRPDDYWRILRQITSALDYVHNQGIIHRDMKPENVFVTQGQTNVRLGDFGLAKAQVRSGQRGMSSTAMGLLTASIGTSVYIAPEVRSSGGGTYDQKVDMYSLGIMLFEMCYVLNATAMERAQIMDDLRKKEPQIPSDFEESDKYLEKELITNLVVHKPNARLSASSLLERIPTDADDDALRRLAETLSNDKNDPTHRRLVAHFFANPLNDLEAQAYTFDLEAATTSLTSPSQAHFHSLVKTKLISCFHRHGAVQTEHEQVLIPASGFQPESVKVMATDGTILQLPYDHILPRVRRLAKQHDIQPCKTFTLNNVFRNNGNAHPRAFGVADFDIISQSNVYSALEEAEVLKVADEVVDSFPALSTKSMRFLINHSVILDGILRACNVPESRLSSAKSHLSKLGGERSVSQVRAELRSPEIALSSTSIDDIFRFDFKEPLSEGIVRLRKSLGSSESLSAAFDHLQTLLTYTKALGVQRRLFLDPLSCCNAEIYEGGLMFQCVFERKRKTILCAGGRYDSLIRQHALSRNSSVCQAVGFSLSLDGVINAMDKYQIDQQKQQLRRFENQTEHFWTTRRCDVLIDGPDDTVLTSIGVPILRELWSHNVRAELSTHAGKHGSLGFGEHPDHELVLMIKADGSLRLRGQLRKDDLDVRRTELIPTLRSELRERDRLHTGRFLERPRLRQELSDVQSREVDVSVLWSSNKSKKSNRQMIVDEAMLRTADDAHRQLSIPIVAVEIKDDMFEMLRETRLSDYDSWKRVMQHADPGSRRYINDILELLIDKASGTNELKRVYLYNFRSKTCMTYDLGMKI